MKGEYNYKVLRKYLIHRVLRKYVNPNYWNCLYFDRSKFPDFYKKQ